MEAYYQESQATIYCKSSLDMNELAKHVMEDLDPNFYSKVDAGDFIVAGRNFGCGSSRE